MNPYLKSLRDRYESLRSGIEGLQTRAAEESRDLTEDELRSVREMAEQGKSLHTQITDLTEVETRNAKVAELASQIAESTKTTETRSDEDTEVQRLGGATTRDRDPGHYTRSGKVSFFGDLYRSRQFNDEAAKTRLVEHTRALDTTGEGVGVVPPRWLTDEFETLARQGRALANAVRTIPLGNDPRPLTLPKQTSGATSTTDTPAGSVGEQASENAALANVDEWDSDVDVVSPKPTAGKQTVSRQMVDMSNPAIDQLIYGDLIGEYNRQIEAKVAAAVLAAGPTALGAAPVGGNTAQDEEFIDATLTAAIKVRSARKLAPGIATMSVRRYGEFLKLKDGDGRPLIPNPGTGQAVNVVGVGSVAVDGIVHGLGIVATDGVPDDGDDTDTFAVLRSADTLLFESDLLRFRFEEVSGPESIVLGIWGYAAVLVRQDGTGVQTITVDPV